MASPSGNGNALDLLLEDHRNVRKLIDEYGRTFASASADDRQSLAERICAEFVRHADLEEQLFYPAVRQAIRDDALMDEAEVEHDSARQLVEEIRAMSAGDATYDAKVRVLGEYIEHHVREEESDMFPKVEKSGLDLVAMGEEMRRAKESAATDFPGRKPAGKTGPAART